MTSAPRPLVSRRTLLRSAAAGALVIPAGGVLAACSSPGVTRARPTLTHGIAVGDITATSGLVWARSDSPATMIVETAATESGAGAKKTRGPALTPATDGTGRIQVAGLEPGQTVHYRVSLEGENGAVGEPLVGRFTTAPRTASDIRFVWSGDVVGQG